MKSPLLLVLSFLFLFSCNQPSGSSYDSGAQRIDLSRYNLTEIPGTHIKRAELANTANVLMEEGFVDGDVKVGTWVEYTTTTGFPKKLSTFVNGMYNGVYLEFSDYGQLELKATYKNNKLHGPWATYKLGRPVILANYKNGQLDGRYLEHSFLNGKLMKEVNYKSGVEHGTIKFYDDSGRLTAQYEYVDGKKVSGGIIEQTNQPPAQ